VSSAAALLAPSLRCPLGRGIAAASAKDVGAGYAAWVDVSESMSVSRCCVLSRLFLVAKISLDKGRQITCTILTFITEASLLFKVSWKIPNSWFNPTWFLRFTFFQELNKIQDICSESLSGLPRKS
jgi:hypothetical protein